jgi:NADH dehydrogenase
MIKMLRICQLIHIVTVITVPSVVAFVPLAPPSKVAWGSLDALPSDDKCDVAIFGGGFGGLYTALALSREARSKGHRLDVALVDPSDRFIFLPLLYDLVMGTASEAEVCPTYEELLEGTGIRHIRASFDKFVSRDLYSANVTDHDGDFGKLNFRAAVVSVGATPQSTLASIPGAAEYTQPFYTRQDAQETRLLLDNLEQRTRTGLKPRVAIVGGGYGGVELAACVKRRLPKANVSLLTRGPPMKGTRAEPLVNKALSRLGINVDICGVGSVTPFESNELPHDRICVIRTAMNDENSPISDDTPWDAVLWTAGSGPAYPVCNTMFGLKQVDGSGRLATDRTLRCLAEDPSESSRRPPVWALGDCSEILDDQSSFALPKTAQVAIQQADVVAANILSEIRGSKSFQSFQYQDLGSLLNLGGPNGAVVAPKDDSALAPLFITLLDTARIGLGFADEVLAQVIKSPAGERTGLNPLVDNLNLSLGGYGLGVETGTAPGTLSGTLSGAARRAIYSIQMPTNKQRAKSAVLGALSTATALSKEIAQQFGEEKNESPS